MLLAAGGGRGEQQGRELLLRLPAAGAPAAYHAKRVRRPSAAACVGRRASGHRAPPDGGGVAGRSAAGGEWNHPAARRRRAGAESRCSCFVGCGSGGRRMLLLVPLSTTDAPCSSIRRSVRHAQGQTEQTPTVISRQGDIGAARARLAPNSLLDQPQPEHKRLASSPTHSIKRMWLGSGIVHTLSPP